MTTKDTLDRLAQMLSLVSTEVTAAHTDDKLGSLPNTIQQSASDIAQFRSKSDAIVEIPPTLWEATLGLVAVVIDLCEKARVREKERSKWSRQVGGFLKDYETAKAALAEERKRATDLSKEVKALTTQIEHEKCSTSRTSLEEQERRDHQTTSYKQQITMSEEKRLEVETRLSSKLMEIDDYKTREESHLQSLAAAEKQRVGLVMELEARAKEADDMRCRHQQDLSNEREHFRNLGMVSTMRSNDSYEARLVQRIEELERYVRGIAASHESSPHQQTRQPHESYQHSSPNHETPQSRQPQSTHPPTQGNYENGYNHDSTATSHEPRQYFSHKVDRPPPPCNLDETAQETWNTRNHQHPPRQLSDVTKQSSGHQASRCQTSQGGFGPTNRHSHISLSAAVLDYRRNHAMHCTRAPKDPCYQSPVHLSQFGIPVLVNEDIEIEKQKHSPQRINEMWLWCSQQTIDIVQRRSHQAESAKIRTNDREETKVVANLKK